MVVADMMCVYRTVQSVEGGEKFDATHSVGTTTVLLGENTV